MSGEPFIAAAAEATGKPLALEALGQSFVLGPGPDAITWLELAASAGQDRLSPAGSSAFLAFAKSCFTPQSWQQFAAAVREHGITDHEDLEELVGEALVLIEGRPTSPSSGSASGSSTTLPPSTGDSSAPIPVAVAS